MVFVSVNREAKAGIPKKMNRGKTRNALIRGYGLRVEAGIIPWLLSNRLSKGRMCKED